MSLRFVAIFPAFADPDPIQILRARFDPLAALVAPHVTLVFPFESKLADSELQEHLEEAVRGVAPFQLRFQGITGHGGEYLFLNVKQGNDAILQLHDRLYAGPLQPHLSREHTYLPHLTVGRVEQGTAFQASLAEVGLVTLAFETVVREVAACTILPDGTSPAELVVRLA